MFKLYSYACLLLLSIYIGSFLADAICIAFGSYKMLFIIWAGCNYFLFIGGLEFCKFLTHHLNR